MNLDELADFVASHLEEWRAEARRHARDAQAAEDAVQEACLRLLRRHDSLDATNNPAAYARKILHSSINDGGRACGRERRAGRVPFTDELAGGVAEPESSNGGDSALPPECERLVRLALAGLTDAERRALRLFLAGVSRREAKAQMAGYDGALNRARAKLAASLGGRLAVVLRLGLARLLELLDELLADTTAPAANQSRGEA
jgi:RNA polymerase sigma factor (sigma-70 family)